MLTELKQSLRHRLNRVLTRLLNEPEPRHPHTDDIAEAVLVLAVLLNDQADDDADHDGDDFHDYPLYYGRGRTQA
ncbi:MAG TPA: hypothetical protein VMD08_17765 [Candidatus Baltobacteraceae bacterium]|nr:hypothetical protein [Candidatus Baltobacteraceae bacterium]